MGKWKLIIMILFILNDWLKLQKIHYNLSIRCMDIMLTLRANIHKPSQNCMHLVKE